VKVAVATIYCTPQRPHPVRFVPEVCTLKDSKYFTEAVKRSDHSDYQCHCEDCSGHVLQRRMRCLSKPAMRCHAARATIPTTRRHSLFVIAGRNGIYQERQLHTESFLTGRKTSVLAPLDTFARRHIGPSDDSIEQMVRALDPPAKSLEEFVKQVVPADILSDRHLKVAGPPGSGDQAASEFEGYTESELLTRLRAIASKNKVFRSYIGCGYAGTRIPEVIKRTSIVEYPALALMHMIALHDSAGSNDPLGNVLEGPGWYTAYTPYQPEISQGRLESLLNYQTVVTELTGLAISNASLLDEATAAAEAMTLSLNVLPSSRQKRENKTYFVSHLCHPQTIAVLASRAEGFGIKLVVGDVLQDDNKAVRDVGEELIGALAQYPDTEGNVEDFRRLADVIHGVKGTFSVATDLLALTMLTPPGEFGADVALGNAQRLGVPLGFGGPHAAFIACSDKHKRRIPGRLIGVSKDRRGERAFRLALQTREQHIRREKATSNICTAQVLLANMSAFYAVYHGPDGLKQIARKVMAGAQVIDRAVKALGFETSTSSKDNVTLFDTVVVTVGSQNATKLIEWAAEHKNINLRLLDDARVSVTADETVEETDINDIIDIFKNFAPNKQKLELSSLSEQFEPGSVLPEHFRRTSAFMTDKVFNSHHSETELLRYIHHLQSKDISLTHSMIPLGSCTMKLNATTEMVPVSWPEFSSLHPFVPADQAQGYHEMINELEEDLAEITGFAKVSLQPNSGAQGEFTALRVIRKYLEEQPGKKRDICLIPTSAHGTNPASAAMCGMRVVTIKCDQKTGDLDMEDLRMKCEKHSEELGAIMITYPSTFGVFEPRVKEVCKLVHQHGGQVYMDGANMNAQIGLCSPGDIGADACHLNLHKTFCIPHGGGGPGVGPIGVKSHLAPFLPGHPLVATGGAEAIAPVSAAPWGSASILPISWSYIKMMGAKGLTQGTKIALLNANYILARLKPHYKILYTNKDGRCAHEFILDVREFKDTAGIEAIDVAKRLQDYGFHAPTMSWPVANTLMIEPTESEPKEELDRFVDALIAIRQEIKDVEDGTQPKEGNVLKMSPHTQKDLLIEEWDRPYSREKAAYPVEWLKEKKFWPSVARLDDGK